MQLPASFARRSFLKLAGLGAAGLSAAPFACAAAVAETAPKMKITDVRTVVLGDRFVVVQVVTDQGLVGIGEASPMYHRVVVPTVAWIRDLLVGEDPRDIERLWEKMLVQTYKLEGRATGIAISGIDIALWDILGKAANLPVARLLGGYYRDRVPVYSTLFRGGTPPQMAERARAAVEAGFAAIKVQTATRFGFDAQPDDTIPVVSAIRKAVGDAVPLVVDANSGWSAANAVRMCKKLEEFNLAWLEQPVPERDIPALAEVTKSTPIPVGFGEEEWSLQRHKEALELGAADILQPDPVKSSGITGCKKIAVLAEAHSKAFTPHDTSAHIGMAAVLHLVASAPNARSPQECTIVPPGVRPVAGAPTRTFLHNQDATPAIADIRDHLLTEPFRPVNSQLAVPTGPGLGIRLNPEIVRKYASAPVDPGLLK
jgi:L-alanine-DL-glutamate epimerase-like enolase superfamily enzyme